MNILTNPIRYLLLSSMLLFSALASAELETIYYHNDHLGNPVAATSATGELMWQEEFTPYGTRQIKQDGGLNHIWYTGKELDADTGLVYFGARWYDPSIGQFLSVDPVGVIPGNRFSYNRYAYANNNPQKYIDPDGNYADLAIEAVSISFGVMSLRNNISDGNYGAAAVDGAGVAIDGILAVIPGIPGGTGLWIKAVRESAEVATKGPTTISEKVRDIEARVRRGETSFPLDTKKTLDSVADGMADNIRRQLNKGNIDRAKDVTGKMKGAIDRLDRFDALTSKARNGLKSGLDKVLQDGLK